MRTGLLRLGSAVGSTDGGLIIILSAMAHCVEGCRENSTVAVVARGVSRTQGTMEPDEPLLYPILDLALRPTLRRGGQRRPGMRRTGARV